MVAKSYQSFPTVGEPYEKNSRWYVKIQKGSTQKEVRWYSVAEYKKLYPKEAVKDPYYKSQHDLFGFDKTGYIYIFGGETHKNKSFFKEHNCTYTRFWGWGSPDLLTEVPADCTIHKLFWKDICANDNDLGDEDRIYAIVKSLIGGLPQEI